MRTFEPGVISLLRSSPSSVDVVDDLHWSTSVPGSSSAPRPADPRVDLGHLELPEPADPVGGHVLLGDPGVDAVLGDAEVLGDRVSRHPGLGHVSRLARCSPVFAGFTGSEGAGPRRVWPSWPWPLTQTSTTTHVGPGTSTTWPGSARLEGSLMVLVGPLAACHVVWTCTHGRRRQCRVRTRGAAGGATAPPAKDLGARQQVPRRDTSYHHDWVVPGVASPAKR